MNAREKLHRGEFNAMLQEGLYDGSVLVTLSSRRYKKVYMFRVRNLYEKTEVLLDVTTGEPLIQADV